MSLPNPENEIILQEEINNLINNLYLSPMEYSLACINKLKDMQKINNLSLINSIVLALLFAINEEWKLMQIEIKRASFNYELNEKYKELLNLNLICKNFQNSPFTSLYSEINFLEKCKDNNISITAGVFSEVYERKQMEFLSKLFITLGEQEFMLYFRPKYNNITDLQQKYDLKISEGYVYLKEKNYDYGRLHKSLENLEFVNKNTNLLENNVKANPYTFNFPGEAI